MNRKIIAIIIFLVSVAIMLAYNTPLSYLYDRLVSRINSVDVVEELVDKYSRVDFPRVIKSQDGKDPVNIILILTDDQPKGTVQHMPSLLKRIGQAGIVFDDAFLTNPACAPSRASILSGGFHSHDTGVKSNDPDNGGIHNFDEGRTLATYLQAAGYATGFVGKYIHGYVPGYVPPGWNSFVANENGGMIRDYWNIRRVTFGSSGASASRGEVKYSMSPKRQYITDFQTDAAVSFLEKYGAQRFFLFLSYYAPHTPFIAERGEDVSYGNQVVYPCLEDVDLSEKPSWVKVVEGFMPPAKKENCGQASYSGRIALLQSVDRGVERIFDTLSRLGVSRKTVVIYMSDNGIVLGRRFLYPDKGMPYEGSIGVPLIGFFPGVRAGRNKELVAANLDVPATIFDIAGVQAPTDGISLIKGLRNESDVGRQSLLIENYGYLKWHVRGDGHPLPPVIWSGLRTREWKYIEYTTGDRELYHIVDDPNEIQNLIAHPGYSGIAKKFASELNVKKGFVVSTTKLTNAILGQDYSAHLRAWGGVPPFEWRVIKGSLPQGLVLSAMTGSISGSPKESGLFDVGVEVRDSGKGKHSQHPEKFFWEFQLRVCEDETRCS